MRGWIVALVLVVAACKGGKDGKAGKAGQDLGVAPGSAGPAEAKGGLVAPKVAVATVLASDDGKLPFLFLVDDAGMVRLAAASSWADLDANKLTIAKRPAPLEPVDRYTREMFAFGRDPMESVASWDENSAAEIDRAALDDTAARAGDLTQDDPPPPEEADLPDDGADDSAHRAEGQYKMTKNNEDPQLARQQAIEQARAAGIIGGVSGGGGAFDGDGPADGRPARAAQVTGTVVDNGKLERLRAMVVVSPTSKASQLIEIVRDTEAAIAVSHAGKIRPLRLQFDARTSLDESPGWLEARVSTKRIVVEAVPDKPVEITDLDALAATLAEVRKTRGTDDSAPVDVLVDPDVDTQRLVDLLVALDTAGVRTIGLGMMPAPEQLALRGKRVPSTVLGQPTAQGDLDKALIRRIVKRSLPKVTECYTKALANAPSLGGTVVVQFFISPKGKVVSSSASGVDPAVATCVAAAIKALQFPEPKGGGGVQVNYPFTFRP